MRKISLKAVRKLSKEIMTYPNIPALFFARSEECKNKPFLWARKDGGKYKPLSWKQTAKQVKYLALGLRKLGVKPGDRVVILSENRPEWFIADLAIMAAGAITVPVYTTNTSANHQHILKDCDAHFAIISTVALTNVMMKAAIDSFWKMKLVCIEMPAVHQSGVVELEAFDDIIKEGMAEAKQNRGLRAVDVSPAPDDLACLIYTSGTGGAPKGVMLSHKNLLTNIASALEIARDLGAGYNSEKFFSMLPLSHAYEHTCGEILSIAIAGQIFYISAMDKLLQDIKDARPSVVIAVPRLFEVIKTRLHQTMRRKGKTAEKLFNKTVELGRKEALGQKLTLKEKLQALALDATIRHKVRASFGGNIKAFVAGGAPLGLDVGEFFAALKMPILQGYGQTEASPLICCNMLSFCDYSTVGVPLTDITIKFALDGEIILKGDNVMKGYWNNPEATAAAIDESGWLHTGDIGELDEKGRLKITDRKKDIIVNSGGDNISPLRVEGILTLNPEIAQCLVFGDKYPHLVAIVVPSKEFMVAWAKEHHAEPEMAILKNNPAFVADLFKIVEKANASLSVIEKVRKITIPAEPFTVENGMMTPTLKVRRAQIKKAYGNDLIALYGKKAADKGADALPAK